MVEWLAPGCCLYLEDLSIFPIDSSPHPAYRRVAHAAAETLSRTVGTDVTGWAVPSLAPWCATA